MKLFRKSKARTPKNNPQQQQQQQQQHSPVKLGDEVVTVIEDMPPPQNTISNKGPPPALPPKKRDSLPRQGSFQNDAAPAVRQSTHVNNVPAVSNDGNELYLPEEVEGIPMDEIRDTLSNFYAEYDPVKLGDNGKGIENILSILAAKGIKWLDQGLQKKYNNDTGLYAKYNPDDQEQREQQQPLVMNKVPPPLPAEDNNARLPIVDERSSSMAPTLAINTSPQQQPMAGNHRYSMPNNPSTSPSEQHFEAGTLLFKDLQSALRARQLLKFQADLEAHDIFTFEDLRFIDTSNPDDPVWSSLALDYMEKKRMKSLIETAVMVTANVNVTHPPGVPISANQGSPPGSAESKRIQSIPAELRYAHSVPMPTEVNGVAERTEKDIRSVNTNSTAAAMASLASVAASRIKSKRFEAENSVTVSPLPVSNVQLEQTSPPVETKPSPPVETKPAPSVETKPAPPVETKTPVTPPTERKRSVSSERKRSVSKSSDQKSAPPRPSRPRIGTTDDTIVATAPILYSPGKFKAAAGTVVTSNVFVVNRKRMVAERNEMAKRVAALQEEARIKLAQAAEAEEELQVIDAKIAQLDKDEKHAAEQRKQEEAVKLAQEEASRIAQEEEAARIAQEEEAARIAQEEEAARIAQEEEVARRAVEEEAEAARRAQEQATLENSRLAEEEAARLAQEQTDIGAARLARATQLAEEEAARLAQQQAQQQEPVYESEEDIPVTAAKPNRSPDSAVSQASAVALAAQVAVLHHTEVAPSQEDEDDSHDGPCSHYQLDMTASTFGTCKCGFKKDQHTSNSGKPSPPKIKKPKMFRPDNSSSETTSNSSGACSDFRIDMTSPEHNMCKCGFNKQQHQHAQVKSSISNLDKINGAKSPPKQKPSPPKPKPRAEPGPAESKHRKRLVEFYEKYNPEKLDDAEINLILEKFKGREAILFAKLSKKYEVDDDDII